MDDIVFIGDWVKDRILGSGSFGIVVLWKHKHTEEKLAMKTCKWGPELTAKHKERWTKEVEMLQCCNNPNIVGTKNLPPEFLVGLERANPSKLPILCMEYCSGGDLRQVLNNPDACGGLKESQVRQILSDIRNAMQFLHTNKITHRDLKPENIVLHILDNSNNNNQMQKKVAYKLIDLGYAKEIDSNSVCASFVGTLQYLAPEIFYSKTYSNSVDFWSFGLLAFEIICGVRPFLPYLAPVQWMPHVKKKSHEHICVYETFHEDIEYSNEIFSENHISKPLKSLMEKWLQVALEWDPKLRGRDAPSKVTFNIPSEEKEAASKVVIFDLLEAILAKKIIHVFSVTTLTNLAYEINDSTTIETLKALISADTKIPDQELTIISTTTYIDLENNDQVSKYWNDSAIPMLYAYGKKIIIDDNIEPIVPSTVRRCLEHPKALYNYKNSQNLYRNGLFFILSQMKIYDYLINGLFARAESLKHKSKQLLVKHNSVDKALGKLLAQKEMIMKMTEVGTKHVEHLKENSIGTNFLGGFEKIFKDVHDQSEKTDKLENAWAQISIRLQSAVRRSNEATSADLNNFVTKYNFTTIVTNAMRAYNAFKKSEFYNENRSKDNKSQYYNVSDIVRASYDCLKLRSKILIEMQNHAFILKMKDLSLELSKIDDVITNAADNTDKLATALTTLTDELTSCMWSTISLVIRDAGDISDLPYSVVSFQKRDFKIGAPVSSHYIPHREKDSQLKSLIQESLKIRKSHLSLCERINSQHTSLQKATFDFSFLKDDSV
ncbi:inhibitor of nuclear factor kappa-B kinase subunit alpha [Papilio machaon]|uniref:inhibitor of nuclear factor kappa-B kinase subunit alpha n=1 Tax=Papilio machaon TaxID=76193 RepID=UPI001E662E84|nr:inhibitor of nuclear factor kappa-B kinase subunit alpha [Papilio machaon]